MLLRLAIMTYPKFSCNLHGHRMIHTNLGAEAEMMPVPCPFTEVEGSNLGYLPETISGWWLSHLLLVG